MRILSALLIVIAFISCRNEKDVPRHIQKHVKVGDQTVNKDSNNPNKSKNDKSSGNDTSSDLNETEYVDVDTKSCIERSSVKKLEELDQDINLELSAIAINAVEKDFARYTAKNGKVDVKNFWNILSHSSEVVVHHDLIKAYSKLTEDELKVKKQILAYAFVFYFENNKKNGVYTIVLPEDSHEVTTEIIVFNAIVGEADIFEVAVCDDLRVEEIETKPAASAPFNIQCSGTNRSVLLRNTGDQEFQIKIQTSKNLYEEKLNLADVEFIARKNENLIKSDTGIFDQATFKLKFNKEGNFLRKLKFKKNRVSNVVLKNLKCMTFKPFDYE